MKPATKRFTMKPVSVKLVFIETGLKPVLKPVLNKPKPVFDEAGHRTVYNETGFGETGFH